MNGTDDECRRMPVVLGRSGWHERQDSGRHETDTHLSSWLLVLGLPILGRCTIERIEAGPKHVKGTANSWWPSFTAAITTLWVTCGTKSSDGAPGYGP